MKTDKMVKKVIPSGNAGGVYVPKKWINQYVVVTLFRAEDYVLDVFKPFMDDLLGIYMHGSHARGDAGPDSDINVLVVSKKDINYQRKPGLNAEIVLADDLSSYAQANPVDYFSFINEAVPLMDSGLLESMRGYTIDDEKIKKFCTDVRISLKMLDNLVSEGDYAAVAYSLIYRLRGLYIVHARVRKYTHRGFEEFLLSAGLSHDDYCRLYGTYRAKRDDKVSGCEPTLADIESLRRIAEKTLKEVKSIYPKAI
jgi:predicted nucleotidyltransferase